jgi:hypothetical protein
MEAGEAANSRRQEPEAKIAGEEFAQKITKDTKTRIGLALA